MNSSYSGAGKRGQNVDCCQVLALPYLSWYERRKSKYLHKCPPEDSERRAEAEGAAEIMKKLGMILAIAVAGSTAGAAVVAYWNFNDLKMPEADVPGLSGVPTEIPASVGTGSIVLSPCWEGYVAGFVESGTTINALGTDLAGESLSLVESSPSANGSYIEVAFSMTGYSDLIVSFATRGTGLGFDTGNWSWSTDGATFTDFGANTATTRDSFALASPAGSGALSALDNASEAYLRYTLSGAEWPTGNNSIDNLLLTAIPEPASLVMMGIAVFGLAYLRRR